MTIFVNMSKGRLYAVRPLVKRQKDFSTHW